jgi:hypothetical protein
MSPTSYQTAPPRSSIINNDLDIVNVAATGVAATGQPDNRTTGQPQNHLVEVIANVPEEVDVRTASWNHKWAGLCPSRDKPVQF